MKISKLGEFGLIERIRHLTTPRLRQAGLATQQLNQTATGFIGIGDDAAVIKISPKKYLLWTTDILIEGIHFLPPSFFRRTTHDARRTFPFMLGWKAMAVNLSDIAAMGGMPKYVLVTLGLKGNEDVKFIDELYRGMQSCSSGAIYRTNGSRRLQPAYNGIKILGGDTSKSPVLIIDVSVIGEVEKENLLLRSGAHPGDIICVTGTCGDSAAGLAILRSGSIHRAHCSGRDSATADLPRARCSADERYLIRRHLMPSPRIKESRIIAENGLATSMIDSSDGFLASVNFLCQASGAGARIYENKIPISNVAVGFIRQNLIKNFALTGGEDYELVFTVSPHKLNDVLAKIPKLTGTPVTAVGEITKDRKIYVVDSENKKRTIKKIGFEHF